MSEKQTLKWGKTCQLRQHEAISLSQESKAKGKMVETTHLISRPGGRVSPQKTLRTELPIRPGERLMLSFCHDGIDGVPARPENLGGTVAGKNNLQANRTGRRWLAYRKGGPVPCP